MDKARNQNGEITLDEFLEQERARLDLFRKMWLKGMMKEPENYPAKMEPGDWDEQLLAFSYSLDEELP